MKKVFCAMLIAVAFSFLFTVVAADVEIGGYDVSAQAGDEAELTVYVKNNPGTVAFRIELSWDKEAMSLVNDSVEYGEGFSAGTSVENERVEGKLYSAWVHTVDVTDDGVVLKVKFKVSDKAATGTYPIGIKISSFTGQNGVKYTPVISNPSIRIKNDSPSKGGSSSSVVVLPQENKKDEEKVSVEKETVTEKKPEETVEKSEKEDIPFDDVSDDAYYYDAVIWALKNNITLGITKTEFAPDINCNRAQAVTFLYRLNGSKPIPDSILLKFEDTNETEYYYSPVIWAVYNGITLGTTPDTFSPQENVTRAQFVTFLWRLAGKPNVDTKATFSDVKEDVYYTEAVAWALENKITTGLTPTSFAPDSFCTRAQIVTFLYRYAINTI